MPGILFAKKIEKIKCENRMRRLMLLFIFLSFCYDKTSAQVEDQKLFENAKEIADRIMIIDYHNHSLFNSSPANSNDNSQLTFPMLKASGLKAIVRSFPIKRDTTISLYLNIINDIKSFRKEIVDSSRYISVVQKSDDFISINQKGKSAVLIGLESFKGLSEGNLELLAKYYQNGVRMIGICNGGLDTVYIQDKLTAYGIKYVEELNRLGIICDITHMRRSIQNKIIELSKAPVIISHGGAFDFVNSRFNTPDTLLQKLKDKGGIIGLVFNPEQLSNNSLAEANSGVHYTKVSRAKIEELIDQIDYLKNKFGIGFVGIGSDYGGSGLLSPIGLETAEGFPLIIYHLLRRGYSEMEIEKVMGLNFIDFYKRVENATKK